MKQVTVFEDYRGGLHKSEENAVNAELGYFIDELAEIMYSFEDGNAIEALCNIVAKINNNGFTTKKKLQELVDALDIRA